MCYSYRSTYVRLLTEQVYFLFVSKIGHLKNKCPRKNIITIKFESKNIKYIYS